MPNLTHAQRHAFSLVKIAHDIVRRVVAQGDVVIDATVGNGHDTLFLAECVGNTGIVYGFDLQVAALAAAHKRLTAHNAAAQTVLIEADHARMAEYLPPEVYHRVKAVMFNLGYLPGGDKRLITHSASTLAALQHACEWLAPHGIVTLIAYPGHPGGAAETQAVGAWIADLPTAWRCHTLSLAQSRAKAPCLFWLIKPHEITLSA